MAVLVDAVYATAPATEFPLESVSVKVEVEIVEGSIAWEKTAETEVDAEMLVAPSAGETDSTWGENVFEVVNFQVLAKAIGVPDVSLAEAETVAI